MTDPATSRPRGTQRGGHPAGANAPGRPPWPVGAGGRPRIKVGGGPTTIRVLTEAIDSRVLPDTYVRDGAPVVIESVSGAASPTAGDEDVALPLAASELRPPLLAALLAHHTDVVRPRVDDKGNVSDEEISPPAHVLSAVLSGQGWPGLPVLHRIISTPVLRPDGTLLQTPGI